VEVVEAGLTETVLITMISPLAILSAALLMWPMSTNLTLSGGYNKVVRLENIVTREIIKIPKMMTTRLAHVTRSARHIVMIAGSLVGVILSQCHVTAVRLSDACLTTDLNRGMRRR